MIKALRIIMKVAWVSRHAPLREQVEELNRMFGRVDVVLVGNTFKDAKEVMKQVKDTGASISVVVLPLSMLAQYLPLAQREGIDVWFAKMQGLGEVEGTPTEFNPNTDVLLPLWKSNKSRWMRFQKFEKVVEVRVVTEPITWRDLANCERQVNEGKIMGVQKP